jgi:hypothetical protein
MFDLVKRAVGAATSLMKGHPVIAGIGLAGLILPKLMGAGSPQAMTGAQQAIGAQLPPTGTMPPGTSGVPPQSPGYW